MVGSKIANCVLRMLTVGGTCLYLSGCASSQGLELRLPPSGALRHQDEAAARQIIAEVANRFGLAEVPCPLNTMYPNLHLNLVRYAKSFPKMNGKSDLFFIDIGISHRTGDLYVGTSEMVSGATLTLQADIVRALRRELGGRFGGNRLNRNTFYSINPI